MHVIQKSTMRLEVVWCIQKCLLVLFLLLLESELAEAERPAGIVGRVNICRVVYRMRIVS